MLHVFLAIVLFLVLKLFIRRWHQILVAFLLLYFVGWMLGYGEAQTLKPTDQAELNYQTGNIGNPPYWIGGPFGWQTRGNPCMPGWDLIPMKGFPGQSRCEKIPQVTK